MHALCFTLFLLVCTVGSAVAQDTHQAPGSGADTQIPTEIDSDSLMLNQSDDSIEFIGSVVVRRGDLRMSADRVIVTYRDEDRQAETMLATGNVLMVSGDISAQSGRAEYKVQASEVTVTENVLIVQNSRTLAAERAEIDLAAGGVRLFGNVRVVLPPEEDGNGGEGN